ncbi:hypothetical protein OBE_16202, partial [human gut metagenome]
ARLFGYAINRKMEVIHDGAVAYMSLFGERDAPVSVPARRQRGVRELRSYDQVDENVGDFHCHA